MTGYGFYKEKDIFRIQEIDVSIDVVRNLNPISGSSSDSGFKWGSLIGLKKNPQSPTQTQADPIAKSTKPAPPADPTIASGNHIKSEVYWEKQLSTVRQHLAYLKGEFIWSSSLQKISDTVSEYNWIKNYRVIRHWPNKIEIKIQTRDPQILMVLNDGQLQPLDNEGVALPRIGFKESPSLPFLRGHNFQNQIPLRKKAIEFLNSLPAEGFFTKDKISDITFQESEGFIVTLIWKSLKVKVGYEPSTLVGLRVNQVLDYLQSRNIDGRVIDANFSKKVLVKLQNHP